jgi:hypothetical protein
LEAVRMSDQGQKQAKSWVERQLRFQRLMEELRTPVPPAAQNGACPPASD